MTVTLPDGTGNVVGSEIYTTSDLATASVWGFRDIPFAQPPIGPTGRWAPPRDLPQTDRSDQLLNTVAPRDPAPKCPQKPSRSQYVFGLS